MQILHLNSFNKLTLKILYPERILEEELTPVDFEEEFEEYIRQCYPETTSAGWMTLDTVSVMKDQEPISWSCAQSEWELQEADEGNIVTFDNALPTIAYKIENLLESEAN